tara:strand:+ start:180 stop:479 length:300 start_codon:yes stop_codon:yes gene_type:complete
MYPSYQKKVYSPPLGKAHYRHFHIPADWNPIIKKIIGKDGCNFIRATKMSGCSYIWHHIGTDIVEIWGPHGNLMKGENAVREIASKYLSAPAPAPEDDA